MYVNSIFLAQAFRFGRLRQPAFILDVVRALQQQYEFVRVPVTPDELLPAEGAPVTFSAGKFMHGERTIAIRTLSIYPQGVAVETGTSTDDADLVIDNIVGRWDVEALERHLYVSQIEYKSLMRFQDASPAAKMIGSGLTTALEDYGYEKPSPQFDLSSVALTFDPARPVPACEFRIERRVGVPFEANVYFSQAPLRTSDHITLLTKIENLLSQPAERAT